jgi:CheY-like chemotaxis protein
MSEETPTVLVVEDNDDSRIILRAWLEHAGYRVLLAEDGVTGVSLARTEHPDVILMDVAMPRMDGWAAAKEIRSDAVTHYIPIIALTALALPEDKRRAAEVAIDGHLIKPASLERVRDEVVRVLRR